jgi:hypothetical protein
LQGAAERVVSGEKVEIVIHAEHLKDGEIRPDGDTCSATLQTSQRHRRHPGSLGDLFGWKAPTKPSHSKPLTEPPQPPGS